MKSNDNKTRFMTIKNEGHYTIKCTNLAIKDRLNDTCLTVPIYFEEISHMLFARSVDSYQLKAIHRLFKIKNGKINDINSLSQV